MAGNDSTPSNAGTSKPNSNTAMTSEQITAELNALHQQIIAMNTKASAKAVKPTAPSYDGSKGTLCGFLTQLCAYHLFYAHDLPGEMDKVLHTSNCLKDNALTWFEPTLCNYLENTGQPAKMDSDIQMIFQSFNKFEEAFKATFGDLDEEQTAECKI